MSGSVRARLAPLIAPSPAHTIVTAGIRRRPYIIVVRVVAGVSRDEHAFRLVTDYTPCAFYHYHYVRHYCNIIIIIIITMMINTIIITINISVFAVVGGRTGGAT